MLMMLVVVRQGGGQGPAASDGEVGEVGAGIAAVAAAHARHSLAVKELLRATAVR